jgi:hypothetical protein
MNNKNLSVQDRFLKLGGLCCTKYISNKDVQNFDYTEGLYYPVQDDTDWNEVVRSFGGLVVSIEHKHKIYKG